MKNDWQNGDSGTRSRMNQPFWIASGTVAAGGDAAGVVRLFISPGSLRYPSGPANQVGIGGPGYVFASGMQSISFGPTAAGTGYSVFVRSDGTFLVSGAAALLSPTQPPRWDAEYLGWVQTGNPSNDTAHLMGPWNDSSKEARGQYVAITATRSRLVYQTTDGDFTSNSGPPIGSIASIAGSGPIDSVHASGIAWLQLTDNQITGQVTELRATVSVVLSGAASSGTRNVYGTTVPIPSMVTVGLTLWRGENSVSSGGTDTPLTTRLETVPLVVAQNPDDVSSPGANVFATITLGAVSVTRTAIGYGLGVFIPRFPYTVVSGSALSESGSPAGLRVLGVSFTARPGLLGAQRSELT
jgi:hypothetical protein